MAADPDDPRGTLYPIATPIGNLSDLSARALEVLSRCRLIACEDTRVTRRLLARHGIGATLVSCHTFNEGRRVARILDSLDRGEEVALVTDAGTPGVSDPGSLLVRRARQAGHAVIPIPGPSAITTLLSASGLPAAGFIFIGFLPHRRGERRRALASLGREPRPLLLFESPRRVVAMLEDALQQLGDRQAFLGREMTKLHEEYLSGTLQSILAMLSSRPQIRGEVALLIDGIAKEDHGSVPAPECPPESPVTAVRRLMRQGWNRKDAMRRVAQERGVSRRAIYQELLRQRDPETETAGADDAEQSVRSADDGPEEE